MSQDSNSDAVARVVSRINLAWVNGEFDSLFALVDPDIVLATPGFGARIHGAEAFVAGLRDFYRSATIHDFVEHDIEVDTMLDCAVASYRYSLDYERSGQRYASTGRDLYVFRLSEGGWRAVWRTILDVEEQPL